MAPQAHFFKKLLKKILILLVQPRGPAGSQLGNQAYSKNSCAKHFSPRSCPTVQSESSEGLTDCQASNWGFPNKAVWPQNLSGRGPLIELASRLKGATENTLCHKGGSLSVFFSALAVHMRIPQRRGTGKENHRMFWLSSFDYQVPEDTGYKWNISQ